MTALGLATSANTLSQPISAARTSASYERELATGRRTEISLQEALAREEDLLRQKDNMIQRQKELSAEADHRLLNNVQMIVSLLSLQSHRTSNAEAASQLAIAADRVATIGRVHQRLHSCDGVQTVAFKQYVEDLCRDFASMLSADEHPGQVIAVEGCDVNLLAATAIPLGFIVNELITNAAKYGKGRITVGLKPMVGDGYALSVSNEGPALPADFDPPPARDWA